MLMALGLGEARILRLQEYSHFNTFEKLHVGVKGQFAGDRLLERPGSKLELWITEEML